MGTRIAICRIRPNNSAPNRTPQVVIKHTRCVLIAVHAHKRTHALNLARRSCKALSLASHRSRWSWRIGLDCINNRWSCHVDGIRARPLNTTVGHWAISSNVAILPAIITLPSFGYSCTRTFASLAAVLAFSFAFSLLCLHLCLYPCPCLFL